MLQIRFWPNPDPQTKYKSPNDYIGDILSTIDNFDNFAGLYICLQPIACRVLGEVAVSLEPKPAADLCVADGILERHKNPRTL